MSSEAGAPAAELLAVLEAQRATYTHLLELAQERHAALRAADAERLSALAEAEEPLLSRVRRLESARLQLLRPWAETLGVDPEAVTVTALAERLAAADAAALVAARDSLLALVRTLDDANQRNAQLLNACLESVGDSVRHLLEAVQLDPRYAQSGSRSAQEAGPRLTDYRA
ncbi:MAG TPA: flagellar protein FlgN [Chloroflexota bacterium]|nr:flagellar protein FlgN [Chloroflexota bacterium]